MFINEQTYAFNVKHTFAVLDCLVILIAQVPDKLDSSQACGRAKKVVQKLREYNSLLRRLIIKHKDADLHAILEKIGVDDVPKQAKDFFTAIERYAQDIDDIIEEFDQIIPQQKTTSHIKGEASYKLTFSSLHHPLPIVETFRSTIIHDVKQLRTLVEKEEHLEVILARDKHSEAEWGVVIQKTLS